MLKDNERNLLPLTIKQTFVLNLILYTPMKIFKTNF